MNWPKLPKQISGLAGPIRLLRPAQIKDKGPDALGRSTAADWNEWTRQIRVTGTASREAALHLMLHELVHAALDDSGIALKDQDQEEAVCQSVASAMMHVARWLVEQQEE